MAVRRNTDRFCFQESKALFEACMINGFLFRQVDGADPLPDRLDSKPAPYKNIERNKDRQQNNAYCQVKKMSGYVE